jgi:hypothetical protein
LRTRRGGGLKERTMVAFEVMGLMMLALFFGAMVGDSHASDR